MRRVRPAASRSSRSFPTRPPEACTECGKGPVHRLLSSPAIQFKGTGFYITDYAQKGKSDSSSTTPAGKTSDSGDSPDNKTDGEHDSSESTKSETTKSDTAAERQQRHRLEAEDSRRTSGSTPTFRSSDSR